MCIYKDDLSSNDQFVATCKINLIFFFFLYFYIKHFVLPYIMLVPFADYKLPNVCEQNSVISHIGKTL